MRTVFFLSVVFVGVHGNKPQQATEIDANGNVNLRHIETHTHEQDVDMMGAIAADVDEAAETPAKKELASLKETLAKRKRERKRLQVCKTHLMGVINCELFVNGWVGWELSETAEAREQCELERKSKCASAIPKETILARESAIKQFFEMAGKVLKDEKFVKGIRALSLAKADTKFNGQGYQEIKGEGDQAAFVTKEVEGKKKAVVAAEPIQLGEPKGLTADHVAMDMAYLLSTPNKYDGTHPTNVFWTEHMNKEFAQYLPKFRGVDNTYGAYAYSFWASSSNILRALGGENPLYQGSAIQPDPEVGKHWDATELKIVTVSDTHLFHNRLSLSEGDILIHAGDLFYESARPPMSNHKGILKDVQSWLNEQCRKFQQVVIVGGNHDHPLVNQPGKEGYDTAVTTYLAAGPLCIGKLTFLKDQALRINIKAGEDVKTLRIFGSPVSSDWIPGNNQAFQYGTNPDKPSSQEEMVKPYEDAIKSKKVSIFVTHGPFDGTKSAKTTMESSGKKPKGALKSSVASGAKLHVFGHWHEQEEHIDPTFETMSWVNPATLNRINAPQFPGYTVKIPFDKLPEVSGDKLDMDLETVPTITLTGGKIAKIEES